jgi:hypothetical protein
MTAFEPIPMGDYIWDSKVSPDGRYLAATVYQDSGSTEMRLIDLQTWLPVASWQEAADSIVHINESGTVYFISQQVPYSPAFRIVRADATESTVMASLPPDYGLWGAERATDEFFVLFGTKPAEPGSEDPDQVFVMTIDIASAGVLTEIPIPGVQIGSVDPVSQGPWASYLYTSPSFTWDPVGGRLLIAHGDEDVVSEVDVATGEVVEHPVSGTTDPGSGSRRISALSPDGRLLYVATQSVELIEDDDDWKVITRPAGIKILDTETWEVVGRSDEPVSDFWVSPNGEGLIAAGYSTEESESVNLYESTGLYLLDQDDLSVRVHYPPERDDQSWGPVTFSNAGSIAYPSTWLNLPQVHALELASGEMLSTAESTETLEMMGPVGVLASNR